LFAALYERGMQETEEAGLRERRRALLSRARGRVLELGAGTGLNLPHYPPAVSELVLTEPSTHMAARLRSRAADAGRPVEVLEAPAELLPLPDASVDAVVATLVLCTVEDVPGTLGEVARVLKPGGELLFIEHVRAHHAGLARWQDRLERPWHFVAAGCHSNRDTVAALAASPLDLGEVERGRMPKAVPIMRPLVQGSARRAA
jgi:ubiquinone/menaquinone biosynthesis C-methylase UbiE